MKTIFSSARNPYRQTHVHSVQKGTVSAKHERRQFVRLGNISRWESTGVPGLGSPSKYCLPGNYVCHVCPFARFISHRPSSFHLSIEVGLWQSSVSKRKCSFNGSVYTFARSRKRRYSRDRGDRFNDTEESKGRKFFNDARWGPFHRDNTITPFRDSRCPYLHPFEI